MSAIISPCGKFRFRLERDISPIQGSVIAYFGVNPSTADASLDDATVRKWVGFTKVRGGRRFIVGNVCAYRSPDVGELSHLTLTPEQVSENRSHLAAIVADADILVPCWGSRAKVPKWLRPEMDVVMGILLASGKPVFHMGLTKDGDPRHPLMLAYSTPFTPWKG